MSLTRMSLEYISEAGADGPGDDDVALTKPIITSKNCSMLLLGSSGDDKVLNELLNESTGGRGSDIATLLMIEISSSNPKIESAPLYGLFFSRLIFFFTSSAKLPIASDARVSMSFAWAPVAASGTVLGAGTAEYIQRIALVMPWFSNKDEDKNDDDACFRGSKSFCKMSRS